MKSKTLYHGSRHLVKILEPKQASGFKTEDNQFAIYAIENKKFLHYFQLLISAIQNMRNLKFNKN